MKLSSVRQILVAAMLAASGHPVMADETPARFCTGPNCLPDATKTPEHCQGLDCGQQLPKEAVQPCEGQDCAPITDQVTPEPKEEVVKPIPEAVKPAQNDRR